MTQKSITKFSDEYEKFSNFYPVIIHFERRIYPTVEHAYVASKTKFEMFRYLISNLSADEAGKAKRMGRKTSLRSDFDLVKISNMKKFLMEKFLYKEFREFLLATDNTHIEEGNHWHDNYWGNCYCDKCKNIKGQNNLGILIMKVRGIIK